MSAETAEVQHTNGNGAMALGLIAKVVIPILVAGILGGIALNTRQEVTANSLSEHKEAEEHRLNELKSQIEQLRGEIRGDLAEIRRAVERRR